MSLGKNEIKTIEKISIRNNYAMALTKKKEPLYWGNIEINSEGKEGFADKISKIEQEDNEHMKQFLLPKRISCKLKIELNACVVFKNIKITDICCNDFAVHFLSEDGMLYTMGKDPKKYGLLGLGS